MMYQSLLLQIYGIVQGVGFRPFVSRLAAAYHITGSVCNKGSYVEIIAQGNSSGLASFLESLRSEAPERATILRIDKKIYTKKERYRDFQIIDSENDFGNIFVSPDIAICDACKKELFDKNNRRYLHPFINCTACGPRLTILDSMPYDRVRTSMNEFPLCEDCNYEYTHAQTRRYDAQPVCCHECGPEVYILGTQTRGAAAIRATRKVLAAGGIVAVKGIGGFHLCCDATNSKVVERLRKLKHRPVKPFAVMARDMETVKAECYISDRAAEILDGHQKPIILLKKRHGKISEEVAPHNHKLGIMLPYAPLQLLLFTYDDNFSVPLTLVMTSANQSGTPICHTDKEALQELTGMCDIILSHNREIKVRADDSVMDFYQDEPYMLRRSRGYAPLPIMINQNFKGDVLGIGGELKNTFCLAHDNLFYMSPYIGDLSNYQSMVALTETISHMKKLLRIEPEVIACDLHPSYNSTEAAKNFDLPLVQVQHHYAHIVAVMAENQISEPVIGVAFDGTGYGPDNTIWGGEFLIADFKQFKRVGSLEPFKQIGGDAASKDGWRIAISLLSQIEDDRAALKNLVSRLQLCSPNELRSHFFLTDAHINTIESTSAGRIFDAVSALLGFCHSSSYEGEAAMRLQYAAEKWIDAHSLNADCKFKGNIYKDSARDFFNVPVLEMVKAIVEAKSAKRPIGELAVLFHQWLSLFITQGCEYIREKENISIVALSGGVFQNQLLLKLCHQELQSRGFTVLIHHSFPTNDGGIALGQSIVAMNKFNGF